MSTPTRSIRPNVNAPFKSPFRSKTSEVKGPEDVASPNLNIVSSVQPKVSHDHYESEDKSQQSSIDHASEIEQCLESLLKSRMNVNIDEELRMWRNRLHAYNEAKDSCLILFGLLAHKRKCLVRDLYSEFGLDLGD